MKNSRLSEILKFNTKSYKEAINDKDWTRMGKGHQRFQKDLLYVWHLSCIMTTQTSSLPYGGHHM